MSDDTAPTGDPEILQMKDYYEDLWASLPAELAPPDWDLRRAFLLGELQYRRPGAQPR